MKKSHGNKLSRNNFESYIFALIDQQPCSASPQTNICYMFTGYEEQRKRTGREIKLHR